MKTRVSLKYYVNVCSFQHDMAYGDFEDLFRGAASDEIFRDKAFNITKNLKYDGYQRGLVSVVCICSDKKSSDGAVTREGKLADELHKAII